MVNTIFGEKEAARWSRRFVECKDLPQIIETSSEALKYVKTLFPDYECYVSFEDELVFNIEKGDSLFRFRLDCFFALVIVSVSAKKYPALKMKQADYSNLLDAINDSFNRWDGMSAAEIGFEFIMAKASQSDCMRSIHAKGV